MRIIEYNLRQGTRNNDLHIKVSAKEFLESRTIPTGAVQVDVRKYFCIYLDSLSP